MDWVSKQSGKVRMTSGFSITDDTKYTVKWVHESQRWK